MNLKSISTDDLSIYVDAPTDNQSAFCLDLVPLHVMMNRHLFNNWQLTAAIAEASEYLDVNRSLIRFVLAHLPAQHASEFSNELDRAVEEIYINLKTDN